MTEITVSTEDLRPGDVILKCISTYDTVFPWRNQVVLSVPERSDLLPSIRGSTDDHFWFVLSEYRELRNRNLRFVVRRPHGSAQTKGGIEEFPHTCTRCGMAAYVGIFEVAHKDEEAAKSCPARRK